MAITRAQQFRQMLQNGGPPGVGGQSPRRGPGNIVQAGGSPSNIGRPTMLQVAGTVGDRLEFVPRVQPGTKNIKPSNTQGGPGGGGNTDFKLPSIVNTGIEFFKKLKNINNLKQRQNFLRQLKVGPGGLGDLTNLLYDEDDLLSDDALTKLNALGYQDYLNRFNTGSGGDGGGGIDTIPYWAQLGFNSENEYLASLAAKENMKTDKIEEEDDDLRIAFRADGGRIGLKGGGADMGAPELAQERADKGYGDTSGFVDMGSAQQNTNQMMQVMGKRNEKTKLKEALNAASDLNLARNIIQGGGLKSIAASIGGPIAIGAILKKMGDSRRNQGITIDDDETQPLADGGRIEAQEGGIMPRLNQLGSGVSSAEQMLQGINQRLESAESSLGGGGVGQDVTGNNPMEIAVPFMGRPALTEMPGYKGPRPQQKPLQQLQQADPNSSLLGVFQSRPENTTGLTAAIPPGTTPNLEELYPNVGQIQISNFRPMRGGAEMMELAGIPAASYADGGNVKGGIMDLESGRQMYFLGKLVKKATRAVKKIVKSPIGKAALFATPFLMNQGLRSSALSFLFNTPMSDKVGFMDMLRGGLTGGGKFALGAGLTALPLLFQEDDQEDEYQKFLAQRGAGGQLPASIPDIRKNYQDYMARAFVADGGRPEPVAKKTMPLLDMDGQEMDLRAEGGFVPIGRMEKADDVPARLSKNEFVFTADAVRNAGDGDVDKGAEVMYNMMKNLEAGGDVSEESQGMDGARKMFQTSQRLEEVL